MLTHVTGEANFLTFYPAGNGGPNPLGGGSKLHWFKFRFEADQARQNRAADQSYLPHDFDYETNDPPPKLDILHSRESLGQRDAVPCGKEFSYVIRRR